MIRDASTIYCVSFPPQLQQISRNSVNTREAQLSQRGRAMLRVIEYFVKSLTIIQRHSK